jgi:hypothetical protein
MSATGAEADVIVAVGKRGRFPPYLSWVRAEQRYARVSRDAIALRPRSLEAASLIVPR